MKLNLRFSKLADISKIVRLVRNGFPEEVGDKLIYATFGIERYIEMQMQEINSDTRYIIVEMNAEIVGFAEYRYTKNSIMLNYIVIDEKYRGKGLASSILKESIDLLSPVCSKIELDVFDYNSVALHWYEKKGFRRTGISYWYDVVVNVNNNWDDAVYITNSVQSVSMYENFGFSVLNLFSFYHNYSIGILGENWIRITCKEILLDIAVLRFLSSKYPHRKFFALLPEKLDMDEFSGVELKEILKSYRMELTLNELK